VNFWPPGAGKRAVGWPRCAGRHPQRCRRGLTNVQRRAGATRQEALVETARVRLRTILMTTPAMIFGMTPLAFELGSGAEFRAPMARAVIGGLIASTLQTLLVVPVVYLDDCGALLARLWHRGTPAHARMHDRVPGAAE